MTHGFKTFSLVDWQLVVFQFEAFDCTVVALESFTDLSLGVVGLLELTRFMTLDARQQI